MKLSGYLIAKFGIFFLFFRPALNAKPETDQESMLGSWLARLLEKSPNEDVLCEIGISEQMPTGP
jgi:hypothetical protein